MSTRTLNKALPLFGTFALSKFLWFCDASFFWMCFIILGSRPEYVKKKEILVSVHIVFVVYSHCRSTRRGVGPGVDSECDFTQFCGEGTFPWWRGTCTYAYNTLLKWHDKNAGVAVTWIRLIHTCTVHVDKHHFHIHGIIFLYLLSLYVYTRIQLFNTAVTRAKQWLVVVGEPITLCTVGSNRLLWGEFIKNCQQVGSFEYNNAEKFESCLEDKIVVRLVSLSLSLSFSLSLSLPTNSLHVLMYVMYPYIHKI